MSEEDFQYCFDKVRGGDRNFFVTGLFTPASLRPLLFSLYALHLELTAIRAIIREPALGELRLQWWMECVSDIYAGEIVAHPVVRELARALERGGIELDLCHRMIEAHRFELFNEPMGDFSNLEKYFQETYTLLMFMGALALGAPRTEGLWQLCCAGGVALGICYILRELPLHRARGQCFLPQDVLERHGLEARDVLLGRDTVRLRHVFEDLCNYAEESLKKARFLRKNVPEQALAAFLPLCLVPSFLHRVRARGPWIVEEGGDPPLWIRHLIVFWHALREKY